MRSYKAKPKENKQLNPQNRRKNMIECDKNQAERINNEFRKKRKITQKIRSGLIQ